MIYGLLLLILLVGVFYIFYKEISKPSQLDIHRANLAHALKNTSCGTPAPKIPSTRNVLLPSTDNTSDDGTLFDKFIPNQAVFMTYIDSRGQKSQRRITVKSLGQKSDNIVIKAFCHERNALRTFRTDRILETINVETGEIFDAPNDILKSIGISEKTKSPLTVPDIFKIYENSIIVMVFIARCDGHFHSAEINSIIDYLKTKGEISSNNVKTIKNKILNMYPDEEGFFEAVDELEYNDMKELKKIGQWVTRLINADGKVTKIEEHYKQDILDYIE